MTDDLHRSLARLADRTPLTPLDVADLQPQAGRRRRTRALSVAAPLLALAVAVPFAVSGLGGTDALSQPAAPPVVQVLDEPVPLDRLQARVEVSVVSTGQPPTLAARTDAQARPLGDGRVEVPVTLTALGDRDVSFAPLVELSTSAQAAGGTGLLGLSGPCGRPQSCVAALVLTVATPGTPATALLRVEPRASDRPTVPGTYRAEVLLEGGQALRIVVDVTERPVAESTTAPTEQPSEAPAGSGTTSLQVFFGVEDFQDCSEVRAVERRVPATQQVATAALQQLFAGPTEQEQAAGLAGYGPKTDGLLRSVRVEDGTAYVDLAADRFPGGFTTSCGGTFFTSTVTATLTQFPTVERVVMALDGDPRAYVEALQGSCDEPVEPGGPCDPAPFRGTG